MKFMQYRTECLLLLLFSLCTLRGIYFAKYYGGGGKWLLGKKNLNWGCGGKNGIEGKRKFKEKKGLKNGLKAHLLGFKSQKFSHPPRRVGKKNYVL